MQHSFRMRTTIVVAAALAAGPNSPAAADEPKSADGWVQLFNGKDLTGWKIHPNPNPGAIKKVIEVKDGERLTGYDAETKDGKTVHLWRVENGLLIGSGPASHLFSEKDDYTDFHYRIEAKINDKGNSGQYFRTAFGPGFPAGYEAQINATHRDEIRTGSLYLPQVKEVLVMNDAPHKPDEYFVQEVIARSEERRVGQGVYRG